MPDIRVLEADVLINVHASRVWEVVSDPRRVLEWSPRVRSTTLLGGYEDIAVGVRFANENADGELTWTTHGEIVRCIPGSEIAFRVDESGLIWSFTLEEADGGGTRVIQRREAPEGISDNAHGLTETYMGGKLAFTRSIRDGMRQTLEGVRAACEGGRTEGSPASAASGPASSVYVENEFSTLRTARLRLDPPQARDAAQILEIAGDPRTVEHNPSDLLSGLPEAEDLVDRWIRHWQGKGYGYWCVRESGRSQVVGYCGVKNMSVQKHSVLNLICRLRPEVWGRGYGTEVTRAVLDWVQRRHPHETILARIRPKNSASRNLALKAGLVRDPALDEHGEDGLDLSFSNRRGASGRAES